MWSVRGSQHLAGSWVSPIEHYCTYCIGKRGSHQLCLIGLVLWWMAAVSLVSTENYLIIARRWKRVLLCENRRFASSQNGSSLLRLWSDRFSLFLRKIRWSEGVFDISISWESNILLKNTVASIDIPNSYWRAKLTRDVQSISHNLCFEFYVGLWVGFVWSRVGPGVSSTRILRIPSISWFPR